MESLTRYIIQIQIREHIISENFWKNIWFWMQLVEKVVCLSLHQNPIVVPFCILAFRFLLFISMGTDQHKPSKVWAIKNRQKIQFYLFGFFYASFTIYAPYDA